MLVFPSQSPFRIGAKLVLQAGIFSFVICILSSACTNSEILEDKQKSAVETLSTSHVKPTEGSPPVIKLVTSDNAPIKKLAGKPKLQKQHLQNGMGIPRFNNFGTEQGMAINNAMTVFKDSKGNLWFGTNGAGVIRYDGNKFTNFVSGVGNWPNFVKAITEDDNGHIWIGTWGLGLLRYDGHSLIRYSEEHGVAHDLTTALIKDSKGFIWAATDGGGITVFDPDELSKSSEQVSGVQKAFKIYNSDNGLSTNKINSLDLDKRGNIWIGTQGSGMSYYNGKTFSHYSEEEGVLNRNVWSVIVDTKNRLWVASEAGVQSFILESDVFDPENLVKFEQLEGLPKTDTRDLYEDHNGTIWMAGFGFGLTKYDGRTVLNYSIEDGLSHQVVTSICEDDANNLWVGSWGGGITRYDGEALSFFILGNGTNFGTTFDRYGNTWNANFGDGAFVFDGENLFLYTTDEGLCHNSLNDVIMDSKGNMWMASESGLSKFDGTHFTNYFTEQGLPVNRLNVLAEDSFGNIWAGTYGGGISRFDGNIVDDANAGKKIPDKVLKSLHTKDGKYVPSFTSYSTEQGLPSNQIWGLSVDHNNTIWCGTAGGGASQLKNGKFYNFSKDNGIPISDAMSSFVDSKNRTWIGTPGGGAYVFDGEEVTNYTTKNGLGDNVVYVIQEDLVNNIIWTGTNKGLTAFKEDSNEKGKFTFENFNKETGFPINDLNSSSLLIDKENVLWGACGDGYMIRFDYSKVHRETESSEVHLRKVQLHSEDICWTNLDRIGQPIITDDSLIFINEMVAGFKELLNVQELKAQAQKYSKVSFSGLAPFNYVPENLALDFKNNNISFDFSVSDPTYGQQMKYQYFLEGYDHHWSPLDYKTKAHFGNIGEGTYTFKVKALNPFGIWSPELQYTFKVLPPWYRSILAYILYFLLAVSAIALFVRWRLSAVQKEKDLLEQKVQMRTSQLVEAKEKVETSLEELKAAQNQLIQSEKMASLGELTAGIAHEIQNPLNFVNNFAEINAELIDEMNEELEAGNLDEVKDIAKDLKDNELKIAHHGKRADGIVKGMLQHSRNNSGEKEATDINLLADEYMRLAYHGLRAKDKSFNATLDQDLDESIGKISVIPQDIGRVILNLFTNAFHSVTDKMDLAKREGKTEYKPTVSVVTKKVGSWVIIKIRDNGKGIPQEVRDKIFQPFFTTKPTGQGTGLGLSLSFDIITKAHQGKISVDSSPGEFAEFTIELPI